MRWSEKQKDPELMSKVADATVLLNVGEFLVSLGYYGKEVLMRGRFALPPGKRQTRKETR